MCRVLEIERTGFYAWLAEPVSPRAKDNAELIAQIKQYWLESGCIYGYRNIDAPPSSVALGFRVRGLI
jgi:putative transposase